MPFTVSKDIPVASKPKIGRNDPCYCGSGKKYKKCHINQDAPYIPQKGDIAKLVDWLSKHGSFLKEVKRIGDEIYGKDHIFDEGDIQAVTETTIYEGRVGGKPPIELFLQEAPLSQEEFSKYSSWVKNNIFSIFEVQSVDFGKSLLIRDLYTNKDYLVFERLGTYSAENGMILTARILPMETNWIFSGGIILPLPKEMGYSLKRIGGNLTGSLNQVDLLRAVFGQGKQTPEVIKDNLEEIDPKQKPGSMEEMLIREMMYEAQELPINKQRSKEAANKMFDQFAHDWLKTPQPQLEDKTPTQVILQERDRLGNPNKELTYKFSVTTIQKERNNSYMQAIDLMQNKNRYLEALKTFASIENPFENLEDPFRFLGNIGVCLIYLGQMELGKKYFQKSLEINPNYQTSQQNLKNYQDDEIVEQMRNQGLQRLFLESLHEDFALKDALVTNQPFLDDALRFLAYITDKTTVITRVRREIALKHVLVINSLFTQSNSETLHIKGSKKQVVWDYKREVQFPKVFFLHHTFLAGGLIKEENSQLKTTRKGQNFFTLTPGEQFGIIFATFFSKLNWQALNPQDNLGGSFLATPTQILQEISYLIIKAFQNFNKPFSSNDLLTQVLPKTQGDNLGSLMLSMMVDKLLLNYLVWMGILESDAAQQKEIQPFFSAAEFRLTSFGNRVIQSVDQTMQQNIPEAILKKLIIF